MVVLKVLREFAGGTSIHGFAFLVSPKSSSRTKIIWAISIVVALSYASWEMRNSVIGKHILKTLLFTTRLLKGSFLFASYADAFTQHNKIDLHQNGIMNYYFIFHKLCMSQTSQIHFCE